MIKVLTYGHKSPIIYCFGDLVIHENQCGYDFLNNKTVIIQLSVINADWSTKSVTTNDATSYKYL